METFNRFSILSVLILKTVALAMIFLAVGVWFIHATGIQPTKGYVPLYELSVMSSICIVIELVASYYMSFVPEFKEPPKPIGWRRDIPLEKPRDKHDSPWQ